MATLSDSLVSSSARRLPIRVRPDLSAKKQRYLGKTYWIVKDPVGLKYYRFQEVNLMRETEVISVLLTLSR